MLALSYCLIAKDRSDQALGSLNFIIYMSPPKYFALVAIFFELFSTNLRLYLCKQKLAAPKFGDECVFQSASSWCVQGVMTL
jgi:hypothetical protein